MCGVIEAGTAAIIGAVSTVMTTGLSIGVGLLQQQAQNEMMVKQAEAQNKYKTAVYENQVKQQQAYNEYQAKLYEASQQQQVLNQDIAYDDYTYQVNSEAQALVQEKEAASVEAQKIGREMKEKAGAMAASSNNAGMSFDALMADFDRQQAQEMDIIDTNLGFAEAAYLTTAKGLQKQAYNKARSQQRFIPNYSTVGPTAPMYNTGEVGNPYASLGIISSGLATGGQSLYKYSNGLSGSTQANPFSHNVGGYKGTSTGTGGGYNMGGGKVSGL